MAAAAGKRKTKIPSLPSGFQYDLPLLQAAGNHMHADSSGIDNGHDETPRGLPRSEPAALNRGRKPSDLQLLALQIEQQKLEIKKLELEAQARANTDSSLLKPESVPSLSTVRQSPNTGKSLGQLDYNVRIVAPQEWPHLHVPFGLAKKKFKDLSLAEFVYGYLDIMRVAKDEQREIMLSHLMTLMRLAAKYKWHSVLSFHAAVLDRIEAGLASWGDDFTELERSNQISPPLVRQQIRQRHIVESGTELAHVQINLIRWAPSMCAHFANCRIIQSLHALLGRPQTHQLQTLPRPD